MAQVGRPLGEAKVRLGPQKTHCPESLSSQQAGTCPPPPSFPVFMPCQALQLGVMATGPNICNNPSEPHTGVTAANTPMPRVRALCRRNDKNRNICLQREEKKGEGEMPARHGEQYMQKAPWALQEGSPMPHVPTLPPVTFYSRNMTHLNILPRHASTKLLL